MAADGRWVVSERIAAAERARPPHQRKCAPKGWWICNVNWWLPNLWRLRDAS